MDHRVKTIERGWRLDERFENIELETLFQRYSSKVQSRSAFLIFAVGNALLALVNFRLSMETLALALISVTLLALWGLNYRFGHEWTLTTAWVLLSIVFVIISLPAPIPHRMGKEIDLQKNM